MKDRISVAIRVLTSVQNQTTPFSADIKLLQSWVTPSQRSARHDELAYAVIGQEVKRRQKASMTGVAR